jgi:hypothetical protein
MSENSTTEELVSLLQKGNEELFELIQDLKPSQMTSSGVQGFRSIKDILAHISYWNKQGIKWIDSIYQGNKPVMLVQGDNIETVREEMAEINTRVHECNLDKTLEDVLEEYKKIFEQVLDKVKRLEKEHLEHSFDFPWTKEPVTGHTIVKWRYWHQQNHTKHIKTWIENQNKRDTSKL